MGRRRRIVVYTDLWYTIYMQRAVLTKNRRDKFFDNLLKKSGINLDGLAVKYGVSGRTLRDWRRGKFLPSVEIMVALAKDFHLKLPPFKTRSQYWYAIKSSRKAALIRMTLYGPPGTPAGRRKGGLVSQRNRRKNPEVYRALGCIVPKTFPVLRHSENLAELFGIFLGDGSITGGQVRVSLDRFADRLYAIFVARLMKKMLGEEPARFERESTTELYTSGVELVKLLEKMGLSRGSKVANQVKIPEWIMANQQYAYACLRGLFDTDGGIYIHHHGNEKRRWHNLGWCFTNHSLPLVVNARAILTSAGITPRGNEKRIFLYAVPEIRKFMEIIGSSNPKNIDKYQTYMKNFYNYEWKQRKGGRVG